MGKGKGRKKYIIIGAAQIGVLEYWFIIIFYFCIWLNFSNFSFNVFLVVVLSSLYLKGEGTKVTMKLNTFVNF